MVTGSPTLSNTLPNPINLPYPYKTSSNSYISFLSRPTKLRNMTFVTMSFGTVHVSLEGNLLCTQLSRVTTLIPEAISS